MADEVQLPPLASAVPGRLKWPTDPAAREKEKYGAEKASGNAATSL